MGKCKQCGESLDKSHKTFCDNSCAATYNNKRRTHSEETKRKISESAKESIDSKIENEDGYLERLKENGADSERIEKMKQTWRKKGKRETWRKKVKQTWREKLLAADFEEMSWERKRERIIEEQDRKCNRCGYSEWLGEDLTLEVHHIGDSENNSRDNLEAICPNCHSMTDDWRGRSKHSNRKQVEDEELALSLHENENIRQALLDVGLVGKGANYDRAKKVASKYGIET